MKLQSKSYELDLYKANTIVLGVDEVGRGPAAGPMVFAGVVYSPALGKIEGINDSKKLTAKKRLDLYGKIIKDANFGIGIIWPWEIDKYGLSKCFQIAINRVISSIGQDKFNYLLLDGGLKYGDNIKWESVIKGDEKFVSIGAASIVAKVFRDKMMCLYADEFPFQFDRHKAYLTKLHKQEIADFGMQRIHRHSYNIVL